MAKDVPVSLLVMSRAFFLRGQEEDAKAVPRLADAISALDKDVVNEAVLEAAASRPSDDPRRRDDPEVMEIKLEVLQKQNQKIEEEYHEREEKKKKKTPVCEKKDDSLKDTAAPEDVVSFDGAVPPPADPVPDDPPEGDPGVGIGKTPAESATPAPAADASDPTDEPTDPEDDEEPKLSTEEMDALGQLISPDAVSSERKDLEKLKAVLKECDDDDPDEGSEPNEGSVSGIKEGRVDRDVEFESADAVADGSEAVADGSESVAADGLDPLPPVADKSVQRLQSKIDSMVSKIEMQLSDVEAKIGSKLHLLDKDMDGIMSKEELADALTRVLKRKLTDEEAIALADKIDEDADGIVMVEELLTWIHKNKLVNLVEDGFDEKDDLSLSSASSPASSPASSSSNKQDKQ